MIAIQSLSAGVARRGAAGVEMLEATQSRSLWVLSNRYLRERFERVEVWCDEVGEEWLRSIGVEYDAWHRLPAVPEGLERVWSIGKLEAARAAGARGEPFLHVDGDVFFRCDLPEGFGFLCERQERNHEGNYDRSGWWDVGFGPVAQRPVDPRSHNFGIFGAGSASVAVALSEACGEVLQWLRNHRAVVSGCKRGHLAMTVEQMWVPEIMRLRGFAPEFLLREDHVAEDARRLGYYHAMGEKGLWIEVEREGGTADEVRARVVSMRSKTKAKTS